MAPVGTLLSPLAFDYIFIPFQPQFMKNQYQMMFIFVGDAISLTGLISYRRFKKLNNLTSGASV